MRNNPLVRTDADGYREVVEGDPMFGEMTLVNGYIAHATLGNESERLYWNLNSAIIREDQTAIERYTHQLGNELERVGGGSLIGADGLEVLMLAADPERSAAYVDALVTGTSMAIDAAGQRMGDRQISSENLERYSPKPKLQSEVDESSRLN